MWQGGNITATTVSRTERLIIPLKRKTTDGRIDNNNDLKMLFILKHTIHIK